MSKCRLALGLVLVSAIVAHAQMPPELKGHSALVYHVAFSPDGKTLATAGFDNTVKLRVLSSLPEAKSQSLTVLSKPARNSRP